MKQWGYNPKSKNDCELFKNELKDILKTLQLPLPSPVEECRNT